MTGDETDRTPSERVDVCVVGAGPAGAIVASELATQGYDVVVLDAGPRFEMGDRDQRMEMALRDAHDFTDTWGMGGDRDRYTVSGDRFYQLNRTRVKGIGGSTLHWVGLTPRLHPKDFEMHSRYGLAADWPISYDDLRPYYARAERELGVAGGSDNPFAPPRDEPYPLPPFPPSHSDSLFADACEALGIAMHSVPQARNSEPYDGESSCQGYGTCMPVCPSGAKYDATRHIERAESDGARVLDRVPVQRLEHDAAGDRIVAAEYAVPSGRTYRQEARKFVVACGGVETPRLLLLSQSQQYPDGLANSSGLVGRYFMEHPTYHVLGRVDEETRQGHIGFPTSESHQFYDHDDHSPGSFKLVFSNTAGSLTPSFHGGDGGVQNFLDPLNGDEWGDTLLQTLRETYGHGIAIGATVEQLPHPESRVTLNHSKTDDHGNPVPDITWKVGEHAKQTARRALDVQQRIMAELGATVVHRTRPDQPGTVAHHMGTTRMGDDPEKSVVDPQLRTHDLVNLYLVGSSVFVTSGAMNPTLTIAALALRAADHLNDEL